MKLDLKNITKSNENTTSLSREQMRKRMILVFASILGFVLLALLLLFLFSFFFGKKPTYVEIENIMKDAAIEYYKNHKGRLPTDNQTVEAVDDDILVRNEYMKPLSKYLEEGVHCLGKVEVDYNNGNYIYTPYLECGKAYSTVELRKKVLEREKTVTSGYGLYNMNNEYVYRGEVVNNYITLDGDVSEKSLWRIVKFTQTGEAVLIKERVATSAWDDRYNSVTLNRNGINDYGLSRIREVLKKLYLSDDEKVRVLTKKARTKLVAFNQCIGKRSDSQNVNDNSLECALTDSNQTMGLLTVSDFLNVSTDPACNQTYSKACQNYNYLNVDYPWWLATASADDTRSVFSVNANGYLTKMAAYTTYSIRPVVHLSSKAMYDGGKGTITDPYKIR